MSFRNFQNFFWNMLALRFLPSKIYPLKYILADSHRSHKKPTSAAFSQNLAILAQFRPHSRILQVIPHKKKNWKYYEKNLAMQDTTNLATLGGVRVRLASSFENSSGMELPLE